MKTLKSILKLEMQFFSKEKVTKISNTEENKNVLELEIDWIK